jgi:cysteine desulfurase
MLGRARGSLRFSLGKQNSSEDIDFASDLIPRTISRLRELSPVYNTREALSIQHSAISETACRMLNAVC